jgi:hypothetical protein
LKDPNDPNFVNKTTLTVWAFLLCQGSSQVKAHFLTSLVFSPSLSQVDCGNGNFKAIFNLMVDFATKLINKNEPLYPSSE